MIKKKTFILAAGIILLAVFLTILFFSPAPPHRSFFHRGANPFGTYPNVGF